MSLLPRTGRSLVTRQIPNLRAVQSRRLYAQDSSSSAEEGSGIQKKTEKGAKPKILEHSPPAVETPEVKKHNEEFQKRPDRAANMIDDNNKVKKGFWTGKPYIVLFQSTFVLMPSRARWRG